MAALVELSGAPVPSELPADTHWLCLRDSAGYAELERPDYTIGLHPSAERMWILRVGDILCLELPAALPQALPASPISDLLQETAMLGIRTVGGAGACLVFRLAVAGGRLQRPWPACEADAVGSLFFEFPLRDPESSFSDNRQKHYLHAEDTAWSGDFHSRGGDNPDSYDDDYGDLTDWGACVVRWSAHPTADAVVGRAAEWFRQAAYVASHEYPQLRRPYSLYVQICLEDASTK